MDIKVWIRKEHMDIYSTLIVSLKIKRLTKEEIRVNEKPSNVS